MHGLSQGAWVIIRIALEEYAALLRDRELSPDLLETVYQLTDEVTRIVARTAE